MSMPCQPCAVEHWSGWCVLGKQPVGHEVVDAAMTMTIVVARLIVLWLWLL